MTLEELRDELPLLTAFVKIVLLDRQVAHHRVGAWLESVVVGPDRLARLSRKDAYRDLADLSGGARRGPAPEGDRLGNPLFEALTPRERAWRFLTGPAGFSPRAAETVLDTTNGDDNASAILSCWPDRHLLRRAS